MRKKKKTSGRQRKDKGQKEPQPRRGKDSRMRLIAETPRGRRRSKREVPVGELRKGGVTSPLLASPSGDKKESPRGKEGT